MDPFGARSPGVVLGSETEASPSNQFDSSLPPPSLSSLPAAPAVSDSLSVGVFTTDADADVAVALSVAPGGLASSTSPAVGLASLAVAMGLGSTAREPLDRAREGHASQRAKCAGMPIKRERTGGGTQTVLRIGSERRA